MLYVLPFTTCLLQSSLFIFVFVSRALSHTFSCVLNQVLRTFFNVAFALFSPVFATSRAVENLSDYVSTFHGKLLLFLSFCKRCPLSSLLQVLVLVAILLLLFACHQFVCKCYTIFTGETNGMIARALRSEK